MEISVLATKCRFCGDNVGRPRDESRQLSIDDLGGETVAHYAPSSNVMDALESFRAEETASQQHIEEPQKKRHGRKAKGEAAEASTDADESIPELDERSKALASIALPSSKPKVQAPATPEPGWVRKCVYVGATVAALIILYFGGLKALAVIKEWTKEPEPPPFKYESQALTYFEGDEPVTMQDIEDAVSEATNAIIKDPSESNLQVRQEVRAKAAEYIHALLDADDFSERHLAEAVKLAHQLVKRDEAEEFTKLQMEVTQESDAYHMNLLRCDSEKDTATFNAVPGHDGDVTVKVGEEFGGRFKLDKCYSGYVVVIDQQRGGRRVEFSMPGHGSGWRTRKRR